MLEERMIVLCLRVFVDFKWIRALQSSAGRTLPWPQFSQTLGSIGRAIWGYCAIPPISRVRLCAFRSLVFQARAEPEKLVGTRGFPAKIIHPLPSTQSRRIPWVSILSRCLDQFRYTVMSTISAQSVICIQPVTLTKRTLRLPVQERPLALGAMRAFGTDC